MNYAPRATHWERPAARIAHGALAGLVGTATMSAAMLAAKELGWMGELPPHKLTRKVLGLVGVLRPRRTRRASAALHFVFGASAGALYGWLTPRVGPLSALLRGALYGSAVWASSYAGWIPALGLMAPPHRDRRGRPASMLLSHLVYGVTLSEVARLGKSRDAIYRRRDPVT